jgi:hypothetical protein
MAQDEATFTFRVVDEASGPANAAADSLEALREELGGSVGAVKEMQTSLKTLGSEDLSAMRARLRDGTAELRNMQAALKNLRGGKSAKSDGDNADIADLKGQITAKQEALKQTQLAFTRGGGSFAPEVKAAPGGAADAIGKNVPKIALAAGAALALAAGLAKVGAAAARAARDVAAFGLASLEARRNEMLQLQALSVGTYASRFRGRKGSDAGFLQAEIDAVSSASALGRERVAAYAVELEQAGFRGRNLQDALRGITTVASTQGEAEAGVFKAMALGAAHAGQSVRALSQDIEARLGGIAKQQAMGFGVQIQKVREDLAALFNGLKLDGFLKALRSVTVLFSQQSATGRGLKTLLEGMFGSFGATAEASAPIIKRVFQGLVIGALKVQLAIGDVRLWFRKTFGSAELLGWINAQEVAVTAAKFAIYGLAGGVFLLAAGLGVAAVALATLAAPFALLGTGAVLAYNFIAEMDWGKLGSNIADGIVKGLKAGVDKLKRAAMGLGSSIKDAFNSVLEIKSPSRVGVRSGGYFGEGAAIGVKRSVGAVKASASALGSATAGGFSGGVQRTAREPAQAAARAPRASGGVTFAPGSIAINAGAGADAKTIARDLRDELTRIFEREALLGAA